MTSPTLKSQLSMSIAHARKEDGDVEGAVSAFLDGMLSAQAAASKAMAENPKPIGYDLFGSWPLEAREDDEGDDEGPELIEPDEWAEAQARAEYHAEEYDWERALGRDEGDE